MDVNDIYKEFNYGIKSAHAIRNFLKYAYENWGEAKYQNVLLIGDANWDSRNVLVGSKVIKLIP